MRTVPESICGSTALAFAVGILLAPVIAGANDNPGVARGVVATRWRSVPVARVTVSVIRAKAVVTEVATGEGGTFEVPCAEGDVVEIRARGFLKVRIPLDCREDLRYALTPGVQLDGRVVSPAGLPADGARVACTEDLQTRPSEEGVADAEGRFSLVCPLGGELRLSAHHPSGAPVWQDLAYPRLTKSEILLELQDGRRLTGHVVGHDGQPRSAQILVLEKNARVRPTLVRTNELGEFDTTISRAERTVLAVGDDGRATKITVREGLITGSPYELRLPRGETLGGRIEGGDGGVAVIAMKDYAGLKAGEPAELREAVSQLLMHGSYYRTARVEGDRFTFEGLEPGGYSLRASSAIGAGRASVSTGSATEAIIRMEPTGTLVLDVRSAEGRLVDGYVDASYDQDGGGQRSSLLRNGRLKMAGLPPGTHTVRVRAIDGPVVSRELTIVAGANELTVTLPPVERRP